MGKDMSKAAAPSDVEEMVRAEIAKDPVVVYSKSYCPYCKSTKSLLASKGVKATVIELDLDPELGSQKQAALLAATKQRTVPNVFIGGSHVGGNDTMQELARTGKLDQLLSAAGATA
eukprot:CAMPEP_0197395208 /NCGR_PEP_ID=MMETSP1165-20131217/6481_1 /TAXON_ID=284809 /ORGANISM="Chrysocystis fragilis, Strain CCMP3189" /LENGTH=116 /DNA_ID=CAMNT_0042920959 /DNA_START=79 /DNA_END=429 /DNA_ORIENTATION=+